MSLFYGAPGSFYCMVMKRYDRNKYLTEFKKNLLIFMFIFAALNKYLTEFKKNLLIFMFIFAALKRK